jgi:hypothetical protein
MTDDNRTIFGSRSEALERIPDAVMDSTFENAIVALLRTLDREGTWQIVHALLTHPKVSARALGLRVVRRGLRDKELLRRVIQLSFSVDGLGELQYWYTAILARYPVTRFVSALEAEAAARADAGFTARNIRALYMHRARGSKKKKNAYARLVAATAATA